MSDLPTHAWRVWMTGPGGSSCEQFPTQEAARTFAASVLMRHPSWDIEVSEWHIPGSAR